MMPRSPRLDHDIERVLVDRSAIERRVAELGAQIATGYAGREGRLLLVPVTLEATSPNGRAVSSVFWLYADVR